MISLSDKFESEIIFATPNNRRIDSLDVEIAFNNLFKNVYTSQIRRGPRWQTKKDKRWLVYFRFINNKSEQCGSMWHSIEENTGDEVLIVDINFCYAKTRKQQLETLYHEITHVKQKVTDQFVRWEKSGFPYEGDLRKNFYWNHPAESEAGKNEIMVKFHDRKKRFRRDGILTSKIIL
jgi:hypothetical protein